MSRKIRITCTIDFDVIDGDPDQLTEDQQFQIIDILMGELPQREVGIVPYDDMPLILLDPVGWRVSHDTWGDLAVNCPTHPEGTT